MYAVLMSTLRSADVDPGTRAPWEAYMEATCACLAWRGALDTLERRHAEDELGETVYSEFPLHTRSAIVTAHSLLERGEISEPELTRKMNEVRARFQRA